MLSYYKEHIIEELNGAVEYMEKAVEHKKEAYGWEYKRMACAELDHANCLLKMFNQEEKPDNVTDAEYAKMNKEILEAYSDSMTKFENLKKLYSSL